MKRLSETTSKSKVSLASLVLRVISAVLCSHVEKEKKTKTQQHECMLQDFYREKKHIYIARLYGAIWSALSRVT